MPQNSRPLSLTDILEIMAESVGDRDAIITADGSLSFAALNERANRLANHLESVGVTKGDAVAVHAENCVEWVEAFYAIAKVGAFTVNVNYRFLADELTHVYETSGAVAAVVSQTCAPALEEVRDRLPALKHVLVIGPDYDAALAAQSPDSPNHESSEDDLYCVFTGGTTGLPKGVMWRQQDIIVSALNSMRMGAPIESVEKLGEEAAANETPVRLTAAGPMMHGGSQWILGNAHVAGGTFVLYTKPHFDAEDMLDLIVSAKANVISVLGDAMARPLAEALISQPDRWDLSNLFSLGNGAAPISPAVTEQLRKALPGVILTDGYGSSESGTSSVVVDDGARHETPQFPMTEDLIVINPDNSRVEPGEVGMLARSGSLPLGYLNDPEKTAATFREFDGKRWCIPGDAARLEEDGVTISLLGRGSVTINSGGEKIHPEEVESVLKEHPAVFDVGVVGTSHERWGQQVTALVQLREGQEATFDDLNSYCRTRIAAYKAPKVIHFVDEVPRTAVSKVDYGRLRKVATDLGA